MCSWKCTVYSLSHWFYLNLQPPLSPDYIMASEWSWRTMLTDLFSTHATLIKAGFPNCLESHSLLQTVHSPASSPPFQTLATAPSAKDAHPSLFPPVEFPVLLQDPDQIFPCLGGLPWLFQYSWAARSFVLRTYFVLQCLLWLFCWCYFSLILFLFSVDYYFSY